MIEVLKSSSYLVFQKFLQRILGVVSTVILARLLSPEDFGLVAIAMLVLWFVESVSDAGSEAYILQQTEVPSAALNSAWTLDFTLKSVAFLLIIGLAPIVSWFHGHSELLYIIIASGFIIIISALRNPGLILLKRAQNYGGIVKISVAAKLLSLLVSIPIAFSLKSYWALIFGQLALEIFVTSLSYKVSNYRPRFDISNIPIQWEFSKWLIPRAVIGYFRNHLDTILVGSFYKSSDLGAYNNMKYFSSIPMLQLLGPLVEPLHVELGKVGDNKSEMIHQAGLTIRVLSLVAAPMISFLFVGAQPIVGLVLGEQWIKYYEIFAYLSLSTFSFVILTQSFRILMVSNYTRTIFLYELLSTFVIGLTLLFASGDTLNIFIIAKVGMETTLASALYIYTNMKSLDITGWKNYLIFLFSCIFCLAFTSALSKILEINSSLMVSVFFIALYALFAFLILVLFFWFFLTSEREKSLFSSISQKLIEEIRKKPLP